MDTIDEFIARYTKEYDFYNHAGRLAAQLLEASLQAAGIRSIVTWRAKSITRLESKCRQRALDKSRSGYTSVDDVFEDIVDLAGVRVALYFPGESDQVDGMITRLFQLTGPKKLFPDPSKIRAGKRFSGYSAIHYRIQLKEQDLSEPERRYAAARIEIQVASVLMHAWSEVEHDLIYKPLEGDLSEDEYAILDQLNGLVIAGEISLERLQRAGEGRVAINGRTIESHYELAVHLLSQAKEITDKPISNSGLGRVDLLFDLITKLGLDTPERLAPFVDSLNGNVELRPLAEQIIDALLMQNPSRYGIYQSIRESKKSAVIDPENEESFWFGKYMTYWVELESILRESRSEGRYAPIWRQISDLDFLDEDVIAELNQLRRIRNYLVHGIERVPSTELAEATHRLGIIITEIKHNLQKINNQEQ